MNERLTTFYVAIHNNQVVCFETNLKDFIYLFTVIEPSARNYAWFYREFKKSDRLLVVIGAKEYHFQRLV